jgi:hypothetical protein
MYFVTTSLSIFLHILFVLESIRTFVLPQEDKNENRLGMLLTAPHGELLVQFIVVSALEGKIFQFPTWDSGNNNEFQQCRSLNCSVLLLWVRINLVVQ